MTVDDAANQRVLLRGRLLFWAVAATTQHDRVMDQEASDQLRQIDATLLAVAIRNVVRAATQAASMEPDPVTAALRAFDSAFPKAIDVRNILEHFDDYDRGTGNLQKRGLARNYVIYTVRFEGEYLLHLADDYELNASSAVEATSQLAEAVAIALDS